MTRLLWKANLSCALFLLSGQVARVAMPQHRNSTGRSPGDTAELSRCCDMAVSHKFANPGQTQQRRPGLSVAALPVVCDKPAHAGLSQKEATRNHQEKATRDAQVARYFEYASTFSTTAERAQRGKAFLIGQQTIPALIASAARRHGVAPERVLALAWVESKFQEHPQPENPCCRSVFQLHKRYWPAMPLEQHIDVAVKFFAGLVRRFGADAEYVYRFGHRRTR